MSRPELTPGTRPLARREAPPSIPGLLRLYTGLLSPKLVKVPGYSAAMPTLATTMLAASHLYALLTLILGSVMLVAELVLGKSPLLLPLIAVMTVAFCSFIYLRKTQKSLLPNLAISFAIILLGVYLVVTGYGIHAGSLFCFFWFPPMVLFCLGPDMGSRVFFFAYAILTILFLPWVQDHLPYTYEASLRLRFLIAFFLSYLVAAATEKVLMRTLEEFFQLTTHLEQYALLDPLTGLGNRRHFKDIFHRERARSLRSGQPFSLLMGDLDYFKRINDTHGHYIGDQVLRFVANCLQNSLRQQDTLFRWGGEEFVAILPNTDLAEAKQAAERMREKIELSQFVNGNLRIDLRISFGVYSGPAALSLDEHLRAVDSLLYLAKAQGRNRVVAGGGESPAPTNNPS